MVLPGESGDSGVDSLLDAIRVAASDGSIVFAKQASSSIVGYKCHEPTVRRLLSKVSLDDLDGDVEEAENYPGCVMLTLHVPGRCSSFAVDLWYSHVAVSQKTGRVIVASWKPCS